MDPVSREAKLYIRDKRTRKIFHIEERYSSLVWTERYQECGEFVLDIPLNAANLDVYKIGNYISFDNSKESMIIESRTINDEVDEPLLELTGRTLSSILMRRVNASKFLDLYKGPITYSGPAGTVVQQIINDEVINPMMPYYHFQHDPEYKPITNDTQMLVPGYYEPGGTWKKFLTYNVIAVFTEEAPFRGIGGLVFKSLAPMSSQVNTSFTKITSVYDILVKICKNNYLGFRSYFDDSLNIVIELYAGADRTSSQKTLTPVVFDPIMDNISYVGYLEDATEYKNTGFTYSDGVIFYRSKGNATFENVRYEIYHGYDWYDAEGRQRTDIDRFEIPFDVRSDVSVSDLKENVDPELYSASETEETTEEEDSSDVSDTSDWTAEDWYAWFDKIKQAVHDAGVAQYEDGEYKIVQSSEGSIDPLVRYKFEEDYNIGDKVDITNGDYGVAMTAYIDEAVKSYDSDGWIITPNFKNFLDYDDGREEEEV